MAFPTDIITGTPTLSDIPNDLAYSPDGSLLAMAFPDNPGVLVYDTSDWSQISGTPDVGWQVFGVAFNHDGTQLAVCGTDEFGPAPNYDGVIVLSTADWSVTASPDLDDTGDAVAFSPDGSTLAVATSNIIHVVSSSTWTVTDTVSVTVGTVKNMAFSHDGAWLAYGGQSSPFARVIDTSTWADTGVDLALPDDGNDVGFTPDDAYLVVAHNNGDYVTVYETTGWTKVTLGAQPAHWGNAAEFSGDGTYLAVGHSNSPYLTGYTTSDWATVAGVSGPGTTRQLTWSPDSQYLALAHVGGPFFSVLGPPPPDPLTGDLAATLDGVDADMLAFYGQYIYATLGDTEASMSVSHGVAGDLSGGLSSTTATVSATAYPTGTMSVVLADTSASMEAPDVEDIILRADAAVTLEWAWAAEFPLVGLATAPVETFYNPQEELTEAGAAALQMIVAYVQTATLQGTAEGLTEARVAALHWLEARAEGTLELDLQLLFEGTLAAIAGDEVAEAFAALAQEEGTATLTPATAFALQVTDELAAELIPQATLLISVEETLDAEASDSVQALGHYLQNVKDMVGAWLVFKASGELVQGWVMNLEGDRPFSEYSEFDFNSMTRIGGNYFAASDAGLHMLGGDTDEGEQIDARLSSMMLDFDTTAQKRVVAAYLGYTSDGTVVLKVRSVDDGKLVEHWYEATEVTADAPRAGYRPLGRGLKSRYWQFELANVDGSDFEIDKLELQPIKLSRRV